MKLETLEQEDGWRVELHTDDDPPNPRTDYDNTGKLVLTHRRYRLPNEMGINFAEYNGWEEVRDAIEAEAPGAVILPVYMIDHSGIAFSVREFRDPWDSGRVGFAVMTRDAIEAETSGEGWKTWAEAHGFKTPEEWARAALTSEVETYSDYSSGSVYGYTVTNPDGETVDSCWGFYGYTYACEEAREAYKACREEAARAWNARTNAPAWFTLAP